MSLKKARAFGGWIQGTTKKLIAFRGWLLDLLKEFFPPVDATVGLKKIDFTTIVTFPNPEITINSFISTSPISALSTVPVHNFSSNDISQIQNIFADISIEESDISKEILSEETFAINVVKKIDNIDLSVNTHLEQFIEADCSISSIPIIANSSIAEKED